MIESRQVFFFEVVPGHWVSVQMNGDFDSNIWGALKDFVNRHETRPVSAALSDAAVDGQTMDRGKEIAAGFKAHVRAVSETPGEPK